MSVAVEHAGIDYHVVLAQNALQQCLEVTELQDELISCLIKQTSRHSHNKHGVQVTPLAVRKGYINKPSILHEKKIGACYTSPGNTGARGMHLKLKNVSALSAYVTRMA